MAKIVLINMNKKKIFVNCITALRIIGSVIMCFLDVLSTPFYIVYVISGLTDVFDGFLARKFNVVSKLGSNLDSIADLMFYTVMMIKVWPYLCLHLYLFTWIIIWTTLGIRILLYIFIQIKHRSLLSSHNYLNKLTGALMFLVPFLVNNKIFSIYSLIVSIIAAIACIYEIIVLKNNINKLNKID